MTYKTFTFLFLSYNLLIICSCFCKQASASSLHFPSYLLSFVWKNTGGGCFIWHKTRGKHWVCGDQAGDRGLYTCPGQHVTRVWLSASTSAFLLILSLRAPIVTPLSRTIKHKLDGGGCISALISAVITFIAKLPLICEWEQECETTTGQ